VVEVSADIKDLILARTGVVVRLEGEAVRDLVVGEAITLSTTLAQTTRKQPRQGDLRT